jgi:hypothetical protein
MVTDTAPKHHKEYTNEISLYKTINGNRKEHTTD